MIEKIFRKTGKNIKKFFSFAKIRKVPPGKEKKRDVGDCENRDADKKRNENNTDDVKHLREEREKRVQDVAGKRKWRPEDFKVEQAPDKTRFHDLGLPNNVLHAIADLQFQYCTPVQAESLPYLLKGKDLIGHANTGTGKSAVFLITLLTRIQRDRELQRGRGVKGLVLAPTRELVIQIAKDGRHLAKYSNIKIASVYGGTDYAGQQEVLERGKSDIVVATPGRLLDFLGKGVVTLQDSRILVIDEADRMLDMGFIPDVRRIIHCLPGRGDRQTLMFSATITDDVKRLAGQWCKNPEHVSIEPEKVAVETVEQIMYLVSGDEKYSVLYNILKKNPDGRVAVFANQKIEAKKLADRLSRNAVDCVLLSGDVPQKKRMARLEQFRSGRTKVLVATDVAGRGIHIEGITHVVNYTLPYEPEDYVHRIGRTGRAGAEGISIGFACEEGGFVLPDIEEFIGRKIDCIVPDDELLLPPPKGGGGSKVTKLQKNERTVPKRRRPSSRRRRSRGSVSAPKS